LNIDWGIVVVLLVVAVPVLGVFTLFFWLDRKDKQRGTRFLGIQMDIAILIIGLLLLVTLIRWVRQIFFG
jgi:hypothetical protein